MPHEVIMPALGMAQDSGLIVSWLKQAGDAVKTGEALMEVETDKAVVEVESPADGYLADVRAEAGENVPVGQVIALITDSADAPAAPAKAAEPEPRTAEKPPEGRSVIMPALGMAQDTGLIVAWRKSPGDTVSVEDVLFEVETDKATMEVAAGHDGYVAALLAEAGQEVPVGEVVAVISAAKPESPVSRAAKATDPAPARPKQDTAAAAPEAGPAAPRKHARAARTDGRYLASPKARRLAQEQGLDLSRLVAAGHPQPYHVSDLQVLRTLPAASAQTSAPTQCRHLTARIPTSNFTEFLAWSATENEAGKPAPSHLMAAFVSSALREAEDPRGPILVSIETLSGPDEQIVDADRFLAPAQPEDTAGTPDLILRDLTASTITSLGLGPSTAPVLAIVIDSEAFEITLDFTEGQLTDQVAIALITGFADRLSDPLRQLL
jgi:pyruvate/2-oxoglutarate dehydrogenase complex dihydrolipoamide acyltransferase (E2) component